MGLQHKPETLKTVQRWQLKCRQQSCPAKRTGNVHQQTFQIHSCFPCTCTSLTCDQQGAPFPGITDFSEGMSENEWGPPGQAVPGNIGADGNEEHVAAKLDHPLLDLTQRQPHALPFVLPAAAAIGRTWLHVDFKIARVSASRHRTSFQQEVNYLGRKGGGCVLFN